MDVSAELRRIFPPSLQEADLSQAQNDFFAFMTSLSKADYGAALWALPDIPQLTFPDAPQTQGEFPRFRATSTHQAFWDVVAGFAIRQFLTHAPPTRIIDHLLNRNSSRLGHALRTVAMKLSPAERDVVFGELLEAEDKDSKGRPATVGQLEGFFESQFSGGRLGLLEAVLEEHLATFTDLKKTNVLRGTIPGHLERFILLWIQHYRRIAFSRRLGAIDSVDKARFATEEVRRELFSYPGFDAKEVIALIARIYGWYYKSKTRQRVLKNPSILWISTFFDELNGIGRRIAIGTRHRNLNISDYVRPQWNAVVGRFVAPERLWHDLKGLEGEIPLEQTEAGVDIQAYRAWAKVQGVVYVAAILAPIALRIAIRSPVTIYRILRWSGGQLLLGGQYAYSVIRVYGFAGGAVRMATDLFHVYLRNPITVNQAMTTLTELWLDFTTGGTGMAPGSSPADAAEFAAQKVASLGGKGVARLADEAADAAHGLSDEIRGVTALVKNDLDGSYYRIQGTVIGGTDKGLQLRVDKFEPLGKQVDDSVQRTLILHGAAKNDNTLDSARSTTRAGDEISDEVEAGLGQQWKATGTETGVPVITMGKRTSPPPPSSVGRATTTTGSSSRKAARGTTALPPAKPRNIDISKPGAMKQIATLDELVTVLKDPRLFRVYQTSLKFKKAPVASLKAANDVADLGRAIARFTVRGHNGVFRAEPALSRLVWSLPEHFRGVLVEHALSHTQYNGWFRVGQLDRGYFPDFDFTLLKGGLDQRASGKTLSPFAKAYEKQISETLPAHLESLVTGIQNGRGRGYRTTALLDVRLPLDSAVPRAALLETLKDLIPNDVRKWVSVVVDEF